MSEPVDFGTLAAYNAERERGITHTPEWDARMADLQREFDARVETMLEQSRQPDGTILLPSWMPPAVWDAVTRVLEGQRRIEPEMIAARNPAGEPDEPEDECDGGDRP